LNLIRLIPAEAAVTPDIFIDNASLAYQHQYIFRDISLQIPAGRHIAILGASGVGKSSLLRMIAGLLTRDEKTSGNISTSNQIELSKQIAYLSQQDSLLPWLTTRENLLISLKLRAHTNTEAEQKRRLLDKLLQQTGIAHAADLYPQQLSGGMRQRAALIRTLLEDKPIILLDEPFSALDPLTRFHLQTLAHDMLRMKTVIFITHQSDEAIRLADSIYIMRGSPAQLTLFAEPKNDERDVTAHSYHQLHHDLLTLLLDDAARLT
jgi:putative hydroxymethylpyrimidine transport system ATP-binding protein